MDKLENITTEVPATGFAQPVQEVVNIEDLTSKILSCFTAEQVEMFKLGQVKRGKRKLNNTNLLKEALYREIETLNLTKKVEDDKIERVVNSKTRKMLQQQVDAIIGVLEMSTVNIDNRHFIFGMLLRLLLEE